MAEVYWIHRPEHTDIFTEGYVGVTSKTAPERFKVHVDTANALKSKKSVVHKAIKSIGPENLICETIIIADEWYCYEVENKLRPLESIGWNVAIGGTKPPGVKGLPVSEETRKKLSASLKGKKRSPEAIEKWRQSAVGRKLSEEHKAKISENLSKRKPTEKMLNLLVERNIARTGETRSDESRSKQSESIINKGWWSTTRANKDIWKNADVLYEEFLLGLSAYTASNKLNNPLFSRTSLLSIWKHFKEGWIPLEDSKWLNDFKEIPNER